MTSNQTILVVEDEKSVRTLLRNVLEEGGYAVDEVGCAKAALSYLDRETPDLITLDLNLGFDSGFDLAREIRTKSHVPIIMVTGKQDVIDRVVGLELGADDYITKPFHVREVLARVRAVLRRHTESATSGSPAIETAAPDESVTYCFDDIRVVPDRMEVINRDGADCGLTSGDFALLMVFLERPKRVLSRDQLMDLTGGVEWSPLDRTIDNQVARLRKKIERNPSDPKVIKTVRGVGYTFACDVERRGAQDGSRKSA